VYKNRLNNVITMKKSRGGSNLQAGLQGRPLGQPRQRFMVGRYEIRTEPLPGSAHMRRYTVYSKGRRIGATVSLPTESDCLFLENPPSVPALKPFTYYSRGRPKRDASRPNHIAATIEAKDPIVPREDLPDGVPQRGFVEHG